MDEKGFRTFLERRGHPPNSIRLYVNFVKKFEGWLFKSGGKRLEAAHPRDIKSFESWGRNTFRAFDSILSGIHAYYEHKTNDAMLRAINDIPRVPSKTPKLYITWDVFEKHMEKAEKIGAKDGDLVVLNLLWSEMNANEILQLRISDIDFEERLIKCRLCGEKYYVTKKAWDALERYIPIEDRGENRSPLFKIESRRSIQRITKKYFDDVKQTPNELRLSCLNDLWNAGKTIRFYMKPKERILKEPPKPEIIAKNLFDRLVQEINNFGNKIYKRIEQMQDEKDFKRILEGYLLATFPDEIITPEFNFKSLVRKDSIIDFAIGKDPNIPIEVKFARKKKRIEPYWRED